MKKLLFLTALLTIACQPLKQETVKFTESDICIIPKPQSMTLNKGSFRFTKETVFVTAPELYPVTNSFVEQYEKATGFRMFFRKAAIQTSHILLSLDKSLPKRRLYPCSGT